MRANHRWHGAIARTVTNLKTRQEWEDDIRCVMSSSSFGCWNIVIEARSTLKESVLTGKYLTPHTPHRSLFCLETISSNLALQKNVRSLGNLSSASVSSVIQHTIKLRVGIRFNPEINPCRTLGVSAGANAFDLTR